jgi:hypothetical protein
LSRVFVAGAGAVSPAGWGAKTLEAAVAGRRALPIQSMTRPGWSETLPVRRVPTANPRPAFLMEPRLRRSTPIAQFVVGAALEALGQDCEQVRAGGIRLGIVVCTMCGCVAYSRRFYHEVLHDPPTASPLLFPETVFNAPGSHLAALLQSRGMNYTLVGDQGTYLKGIALAADWLRTGQADGCLVIGAEELDWVVPDAQRHFADRAVLSEGAGALYLKGGEPRPGLIELVGLTNAHLYVRGASRVTTANRMREELLSLGSPELLCDGLQGVAILDRTEQQLWRDWSGSRTSPLTVLGEGFLAGAAWRCVMAVRALERGECRSVGVSVVGCNEQAVGARLEICL